MTDYGYQVARGSVEAANGDVDKTVIAAQGANKTLRLKYAIVSVTLAATGGTGEVALEDGVGGTRFFEADADAVGVYRIDFGEWGYPLTSNTLLNLTVDGAGTNQATARCMAIAKVV